MARSASTTAALYDAYHRGEMARAEQIQERIKPLRAAFSMALFR
jgi:hypothetical protein